jgi:MFS family permease
MTPIKLLLVLCGAEILTMAPFSSIPALLPRLVQDWHMSATQEGLLGGSYFLGYLISISHLSGATDRIDAKKIYLIGSGLAGLGSLLFIFIAHNWYLGCLSQLLCGAGLAGTYMPGLRALTDRMPDHLQTRYVAFYTSTFGIGASLSYAMTGWISHISNITTAFLINGLLPFLAILVITIALQDVHHAKKHSQSLITGQLNAIKNKNIRNYILGYSVHCWELFAFRSWIVVILTEGLHGRYSATLTAAIINLVGIPASILGNEFASQNSRAQFIKRTMFISGILAWACGLFIHHMWILLFLLPLYFFTVMADSGALTAGLIEITPKSIRGAAMAIYSLAGFGAGFLGPIIVGMILDILGGQHNTIAWVFACGSMGIGSLIMSWKLKTNR